MSIRFTSKRQNRGELCVMSCDSGKPLALRILKHLNGILRKEDRDRDIELKLVDSDEITFANGEIKTVINENIRGADLYIIQSIDDPLLVSQVADTAQKTHHKKPNKQTLAPGWPCARFLFR